MRNITADDDDITAGQAIIDVIEDKAWKRGRSKGRREGLQQGIEKGLEQGLEQGLEPVVHMFSRKLGRPLTDRQRATLLRRLDTLGPSRLGDVVLDLDAAALAAWLANPRAQ